MTRVAHATRARSVHASGNTAARQHDLLTHRKKPSYKVVLEQVTQEKKKLITVGSFQASPPPGYTFIPAGDPQVTSRCKEIARLEGAKVFIVSTKQSRRAGTLAEHVHRVGHHFPSSIVARACTQLNVELDRNGRVVGTSLHDVAPLDKPVRNLRSKKRAGLKSIAELDPNASQALIDTQARSAIKDLFPRIPDEDVHYIVTRAFEKDTGRVGTASELSLARRVQLAVVAHIRHMYTDYDHLLRHVDWQTARAMVEQRSLDIIARWMNEDDDPDAVEDILREVIVIPDDDDDGVAKEARTRDGDPTQCTSSGEIEIVSNLAADDLETRALDYGAKDGSPSQFDSPASEKAEAAQYQGRGQYVHINPRPLNLHRSEQIGQHRQRAWEEALSRRRNPDQAAPQRLRPFPGSADQISHPHYTRPLAGSQVPLQSDNGNRLIYIGSRPHTQAPVYQTIAPSHPESLISQRPVQRIGLGGRSLSGHVSVAAPNGVDLHRPIRYYQHEQQLSSNPREYRPEHVYIPQREEDLPNQSNARRPKTPETIIPSIEGTSRSVPDPTLEANRQKLPDYTSNRERAYQNIVRHPEPVTNLRHEYHEDQAQSKRRRTEYLPSHGEQPTRMQDYVREGGSILIPLEGTASSFKSQHSLPYYEGKPQSLELRNVSSVTTLREADPRYQQTLRPRPQQAFFVQPHTLHAQETSQRKNDMSPFNSVKRASYPYPVIPLEVEGTQSRSRDHIQEPTSTIWTEFQSPHARRELEFSPRSPHASADEQYWFREGPQTLAIAGASQQGPERLISQPQPIETFRGNGQPLASVRNIRGHQQTGSWDSRPADAHDLRRGGSPAPSPLQNLQNLHIVQPSSQGVKREWPSQSHHKPEIFPSYPTVPTSTHYPSQPAPHVQPNGSQDRRNRDRRFLDHNTPYRSQQYAPEAPLGLQLSSQSQARQPPAMYPSSEQPQIHRRTIDPRSGREIIVLE